ncbi:MAG: BrnT family toxin [Candidatus Tectomicrobia bacterium]|nr:BrnT family toxin [Candidatus Tectomicrobia bacterium]
MTKRRPSAYTSKTEFKWDDAKNNSCFTRRGFDFAYAIRAFLDPHRIVAQDRRRDYGEARYQLLGKISGRAYVVVYTLRGSTIRIISARKANGKEIAGYEYNARQD